MNRIARCLRLTTLVAVLLLPFAAAQTAEDLLNPPPGEWPTFGRTVDQQRFSPLDQVNDSNVQNLRMVWSRDLNFDFSVQGGPVMWDGVMYVTTYTGVIALDARTGDQICHYSEPVPDEVASYILQMAPRGGPVVFDGKVFITRRDPTMVALDAKTGEVLWRTPLGDGALGEGFTTGPIFAGDRVVAAPQGADLGGAPGRILALDTEVGELLWQFNTVPLSPDDAAWDTWNPMKPSWEAGVGGGSAWNVGAYDHATRTILYGTGQPTPWDRISDRRRDDDGTVSADLYTASFVAVDADSGEIKWYHQVVPGDEWDYDQHTVPIFADLEIDGQNRRLALLATTTGFIVLLDAATGEFLRAHQIHPENTIHMGYEADGTPIINPEARYTEEDVPYRMCPGLRWAHIAPGAFSPETGLMYRPNNDICLQLGAQTMPDDWQPGDRAYWALFGGSDAETDYFDRWGALSAIDPLTGEVVWEHVSDYAHNAGAIATAGNLVFSAFADRVFRAFDARTGEILFEQILTSASQGSPITYMVDGVQYVAAYVGSPGTAAPKPGSPLPRAVAGNPAIFVFALR